MSSGFGQPGRERWVFDRVRERRIGAEGEEFIKSGASKECLAL